MIPDIRWFAGFFDGEGSLGLYNRGVMSPRLQLGISGTHRESIEVWKRKYGGSVSYTGWKKNHRPHWQWMVGGMEAYRALRDMFPFLIVKREQAGLALTTTPSVRGRNISADERSLRFKVAAELRTMKKAV